MTCAPTRHELEDFSQIRSAMASQGADARVKEEEGEGEGEPERKRCVVASPFVLHALASFFLPFFPRAVYDTFYYILFFLFFTSLPFLIRSLGYAMAFCYPPPPPAPAPAPHQTPPPARKTRHPPQTPPPPPLVEIS